MVSREAPRSDPQMLAMPPITTMVTSLIETRKSNEFGLIKLTR